MKRSKEQVNSAGGSALDGGLAARAMPESLAAEAAVLGSMVIDPACISEVVDQLSAEAFYRVEHQIIYEALVSLYERNRGEGIDGVLLRDELERRGRLQDVGGVEYLAKVLESVPTSANVQYYTGIVKDKLLQRQIIAAATEILDEAYAGDGDTDDKLDRAEQKIFAVTNKRITSGAAALKDLVTQAYEAIERRDGTVVTGIATGYHELDDITCGLQSGEMIIIAGRPSMGKTSLALNIAEHVAVHEKLPVAIFSLEMGQGQLAERILCSQSRIDSQMVRRGLLNTDHYQELVKACSVLSEAPIYIDDTAGLAPLELRAKARRLTSRFDIRLIVLDYLQLMSVGAMKAESRQQEITAISRYIKALARELNIPVVVLSQLNRAAENREDHRPRMSDLRESGSLEQDADVVMLLHREDYYHRGQADDNPTNVAEVIIAKQRNGPTGTVKLTFLEKLTRFENLAAEHVQEPF
jgi:replicative DNA helicase